MIYRNLLNSIWWRYDKEHMKQFKTYIILFLAAISGIVIFQNAHAVRVKFLLWEVFISQALLLPLVLLAGFIIGWLVSSIKSRK